MSDQKTAPVISDHSVDFVGRCGGSIALHQSLGYEVTVVCQSYGECAKLWKQEGMTLERAKSEWRIEAVNAAAALCAQDIQFFDCGDYPPDLDAVQKEQLVEVIRAVRRHFILSHSQNNPNNTDHMYVMKLSLEERMIAQALARDPWRNGTWRAAVVPVRTTPDRTDTMQGRHFPRHYSSLGQETRRPFLMHLRREAGWAKLPVRRRAPANLSSRCRRTIGG